MIADVAVVGAGLAGIACARQLVRRGVSVVLFDKGRKPGGRLSTRRADAMRFDHGAPHFSVAAGRFAEVVESWATEGWVSRWRGRFVTITDQGREDWSIEPWVGVPTMSALPRALAEALDVRAPVRIGALHADGGAWRLVDEHGDALGTAKTVIVNTPAGQAAPLLHGTLREQASVANDAMDPCWTVMVVPSAPWDPGFDAAQFEAGPLSRATSQLAKPGRDAVAGWVLHASGAWTREHWDDAPDDVIAALTNAADVPAAPTFVKAHRWRYARTRAGVQGDCLWDPAARLGACGDWCGGPGLEGAWRSGEAMAARILGDSVTDPARAPG